jgi:hypothetical protein
MSLRPSLYTRPPPPNASLSLPLSWRFNDPATQVNHHEVTAGKISRLSLTSLISSLSLTLSLFPSARYYPSVCPPPISCVISSTRASKHRSGTQPAKNSTPAQDLGHSLPDLGSCLFVCGFEILCVNLICKNWEIRRSLWIFGCFRSFSCIFNFENELRCFWFIYCKDWFFIWIIWCLASHIFSALFSSWENTFAWSDCDIYLKLFISGETTKNIWFFFFFTISSGVLSFSPSTNGKRSARLENERNLMENERKFDAKEVQECEENEKKFDAGLIFKPRDIIIIIKTKL